MHHGELINFFFHLALQVKLYHWQTKSYSRHTASDKLHENILELSDRFIEVYVGKYGREHIEVSSTTSKVTVGNLTDSQIIGYLRTAINFLEKDLLGIIDDKKNTDLLNIRDELLGCINRTLYLFTLT
jgi:hypothetical protein